MGAALASIPPSPIDERKREIRKRDGETVQEFDAAKIRAAIAAAWTECHEKKDDQSIDLVARDVLRSLPFGIVDVETVQDIVEVALMRAKAYDVAKAYIIYRQKRTEARALRDKRPDPEAVGGYIHASKYARHRDELGRREVYEETVARVEAMHLGKFPGLEVEIRRAFDFVRDKRVLPSMRSMQFSGPAILTNHQRMYNCTFGLVDHLNVFGEAMFLLLSGSGVGYSVHLDHTEKMPPLGFIDARRIRHHVVGDSIEGWADTLKALVQSYTTGEYLEVSYHLVRPAGTPLKTSGGVAPGHVPLKTALERVRRVLDAAQGRRLRPIESHRIMCHAADAVLSGGVRRSAMIALFSLEDSEMMNCKTGNWFAEEPWLANANNSVALMRGEAKKKQFTRIFEMTKQWGEPGFFFSAGRDYGTNPCVPAGTRILTREGYVPIETRVGKPTVVWNGIGWKTVTPSVTGRDQPMVRVHLSDGTSLDCTERHEWCIAMGRWSRDHIEERVEASDLEEGDVILRYDMPVVEGGADMPHAYTHGFFCADGAEEDAGRRVAYLYGAKQTLIPHLETVRVGAPNEDLDRTRVVFPEIPEKFSVPLDASARSKIEWLAGLFDGDGSIVKNPKSINIQLPSVNLPFLREVRLMLTTLGVQAKIGKAKDEGANLLPDGKGGMAEYPTQELNRLLINATDAHKLVRLGLETHRLDLSGAKLAPQRDARRFVTVLRVEPLPMADTVYCFTEPSNHTGTFEGIVTGQCCEIGLYPRLTVDDSIRRRMAARSIHVSIGDVLTGWAFCNLCEINAAKFTSRKDFLEAAQAATLIGTLQAAYTDMPYLGWVSEEIAKRDALLGVGMTGMLDAPQVACNATIQREVAGKIKEWNAEYAARIGIRPAARTTCVKPSGTTSLELGCVASGHHPHHARRYIRRVIAVELEPVFQAFREKNPHMCVRKPDGKWVIEFPVQAPDGAIVKKDLSAIEFLEMVCSTQENWVAAGTASETHSPKLSHNVSNTATVRPHEWEAVAEYLWQNQEHFSGVSLIASSGDKDYAFAPNEEVLTEADEARWNHLVQHYVPLDYAELRETADGTNLTGEAACVGGACAV